MTWIEGTRLDFMSGRCQACLVCVPGERCVCHKRAAISTLAIYIDYTRTATRPLQRASAISRSRDREIVRSRPALRPLVRPANTYQINIIHVQGTRARARARGRTLFHKLFRIVHFRANVTCHDERYKSSLPLLFQASRFVTF